MRRRGMATSTNRITTADRSRRGSGSFSKGFSDMSISRTRFAVTKPVLLLSAVLALAVLLGSTFSAVAQDDDVQPAPASIGADVPLTYFGPAPSQVQDELVGPLQLLRSGTI